MKENEMGRSCNKHGRAKQCKQNFGRNDRDHLGDLGVYVG